MNYKKKKLSVKKKSSVKKLFLKTSQNSQENTFVGVSFNKVAGLRPKAASRGVL